MFELELMTKETVMTNAICYPAQDCSPEDAFCLPAVPTCTPGCSPQ